MVPLRLWAIDIVTLFCYSKMLDEMSREDRIGTLFTDRDRFILFDGLDSCTLLLVYESLKLCTDICIYICVCVCVCVCVRGCVISFLFVFFISFARLYNCYCFDAHV